MLSKDHVEKRCVGGQEAAVRMRREQEKMDECDPASLEEIPSYRERYGQGNR